MRFTVTCGTIAAVDNANLQDHDPYQSDHRHGYNGRGLAIVRAGRSGPILLGAAADGLRPASVRIAVARGTGPETIPPAR